MKHFSRSLFLGCLISILPVSFATQQQTKESKSENQNQGKEVSASKSKLEAGHIHSHNHSEKNVQRESAPVATIKYNNLEKAFKKIKNVNSKTVVIIDCNNIVQTPLDSAFVYKKDYEKIWNSFYEKLNDMNADQKEAILDSLRWGIAKAVLDQKKFKPHFEKLLKSGARIIFVCKIENTNQNLFSVFSNISEILRNAGLDIVKGLSRNNSSTSVMTINRKEGTAQNSIVGQPSDKTQAHEHSVIFFDKDLSADLNEFLRDDFQAKKFQKIVVLSSEPIEVDTKVLQIPVENVNFDPQIEILNKLPENLVQKQLDVLSECGYWADDQEIVSISQKEPKDLVFEICKRDILNVCSCREVNEVMIYKKIMALLDNQQVPGLRIPEIIDYFQEANASFGKVFQLIVQRHLWEIGEQLGLDEKTRTDILSKIPEIDFLKVRVEGRIFSALRSTCSGIHWKDIAKYLFLQSKMFDKSVEDPDYGTQYYTEAHNIYKKVMELLYERDSHEINTLFSRIKLNFVTALSAEHKDKLERACELLKLDYKAVSTQLPVKI